MCYVIFWRRLGLQFTTPLCVPFTDHVHYIIHFDADVLLEAPDGVLQIARAYLYFGIRLLSDFRCYYQPIVI